MCKLFYYVLVGGDMSRFSSNTEAQQARLLAYFLAHHTITTLEAREQIEKEHCFIRWIPDANGNIDYEVDV